MGSVVIEIFASIVSIDKVKGDSVKQKGKR